jgi:hypothetical protein
VGLNPLAAGQMMVKTNLTMPLIHELTMRQDAAYERGMVSESGTPMLPSFITFSYTAHPHKDNDDCVTYGRVDRRDPSRVGSYLCLAMSFSQLVKVPRRESNFYLWEHKVFFEMTEGFYWTWRASDDLHGTTMNSARLDNPAWREDARQDPDNGSWTHVNVLPSAVGQAFARKQNQACFWRDL